MKKLSLSILGIASIFLITSCTKTTKQKNLNLEWHMPEYQSNYSPIIGEKLPEIRINSETGTNSFVTEPVSFAVKEQKKGWISNPNDPQLTAPDPYYEACTINVIDDLGQNSISDALGQVKVRGNWTTDYEKKPLRIKFDSKQAMLGLNNNTKAKSWVLLASYKDWSLLRDSVGFYLSKMISRNYVSDFRLVDVYINDTYWGVYLLCEQQQVSKNRINISAPDDAYTQNDIGYLLEFDGYSKYEDYSFDIDYKKPIKDINGTSLYKNLNKGYTIKSDIYSTSQVDFISDYMNKLWDICYSALYDNDYKMFNTDYTLVKSNAASAFDCIKNVIDIESLVDAYIIQELVVDPDIYWSSFYMDIDFKDTSDKLLRFEAPWDFDSCLGNKYSTVKNNGYYAGIVGTDVNKNPGYGNPWMILFSRFDWFNNLVKEKWTMIYDSNIFNNIYTYIDSCQNNYKDSLDLNFVRWNNARYHSGVLDELSSKAKACSTQAQSAQYLKEWLDGRIKQLNNIYHI